MVDEVDVEDTADTEEQGADGGLGWSNAGGVRSIGSGLLLLGALILLFWNEGASKRHGDAIVEASREAQTVSATLDRALEGKPVHVSATVESAGGTLDPLFGIRSSGVALYRDVQMFQWIELAESTGRSGNRRTTYRYVQDWSDVWHDSSKFHEPQGHQNPRMPFESEAYFAPDARLGPFRFDNEDVLWQATYAYGDTETPGTLGDWARPLERLPALSPAMSSKGWFQLEPDEYYRGNADVEEVEIGDVSVRYYEFRPGYTLTMIGAQRGDRIEHWTAGNGDQVLLAAGGAHTASGIGRIGIANNDSNLHFLRIVGLIGAVLGGAGIAAWFGGLLTAVPVVGRLVHHSLMLAGGLFGLMAALLTIVIGWLAARPWIAGLILLGIAAALAYVTTRKQRADVARRKKARGIEAAQQIRQRAIAANGDAESPVAPRTETTMAGNSAALTPPPPPPASPKVTGASASPSQAQAKASASAPTPDEPEELPPIEWQPGLLSPKPPSVRPRAEQGTGATASSNPTQALVGPHARANAPTRSVAEAAATSSGPPPDSANRGAAPHSLPFETVPTRRNELPFETVEPRASSASAQPPSPPQPAPPARTPATATLGDALATPPRDSPPASANPPAAPSALKRVPIGSKGPYQVNKIVKVLADGEQVMCFELMRDGKPIQRGTQAQIKEALATALANA